MRGGAPNVAAGLVFCDVAVRTPSGRYRSRTLPIQVPRDIFGADGKTVKFGFRGWTQGAPDPTQLALCEIPNTPAATDWFKRAFSAGGSPRLPAHAAAKSPSGTRRSIDTAPSEPSPSAITTADPVVVYDVQMIACDESALVDYECGCTGETCPGWEGGEEITEGPPPAEPEQPVYLMGGSAAYDASTGEYGYDPATAGDYTYDSGSGAYYSYNAWSGEYQYDPYIAQTLSCNGLTDRPHRSGTPGYTGNVNVHSRTTCNLPTSVSVSVTLARQKCLWIFCWWSPVDTNSYSNPAARQARTNAAALCVPGWYRALGWHTAVFPTGPASAATANGGYVSC
jgi:hypothetical protein